jgi:hypothetical protein
MKELSPILSSLAIRLMVASGLLVVGFTHIDIRFMLHIPLLILLASIIVAKPISHLLASPAGWLFFPNQHFDRPQPVYGIPEARRKVGQPEQAMEGYSLIVAEHPQELKAWINLLDVALLDLDDPKRAATLYETGMNTLKKPEDRDQLATLYTVFLARGKQSKPGPKPTEN